MGLRATLEAKRRRTLAVPILVSDPAQDRETLVGISAALALARERAQRDEADEAAAGVAAQIEAQYDDAVAKLRSNWADVALQSLPRGDWEAAQAAYQGSDTLDWDAALPALLAVSCVDRELQDEAWWREQLAKPEWSEGDINALRIAVLQLNVEAAEPHTPKG